jgi:DNA ligase (NAD+)
VPVHCPECGYPVRRDGEYLVCPNSQLCPAQITGSLKAWVKKIGVLDWGESLIESLCASGAVVDIADLYKLTWQQVSPLQMSGRRVGDSMAQRCVMNLHAKSELPLHLLVGSLGIPMVARSITRVIVQGGFDTLDKMEAATVAEIAALSGVGQSKAESFVSGFKERLPLIKKLLVHGVTVKQMADGPLKGKNICMTGFRDPDMADAIEDAGGVVKSGVSKNLSYLVAADASSTSGKAKKARQYGIEVISIDDMWGLLR